MTDPDNRPLSPQLAREQASESLGFLASRFYDVGNGETLELPHPEYFDDDQQAAYDQLKLDSESWVHEEYDRANPLTGEIIIHPETGKPVKDRRILLPHRELNGDGKPKLVENFNVQMCKTLWGNAGYKKFKAAGGRANQVAVDLKIMQLRFQERLDSDPKSEGRDVATEEVPDQD